MGTTNGNDTDFVGSIRSIKRRTTARLPLIASTISRLTASTELPNLSKYMDDNKVVGFFTDHWQLSGVYAFQSAARLMELDLAFQAVSATPS